MLGFWYMSIHVYVEQHESLLVLIANEQQYLALLEMTWQPSAFMPMLDAAHRLRKKIVISANVTPNFFMDVLLVRVFSSTIHIQSSMLIS